MKAHDAEFCEVQEQFERDLRASPIYVRGRIDRAARTSHAGQFFDNGEVNNMFLTYMMGYAFAKSLARQSVLKLDD